jgi:hypothetical protein
MKTLKTLFVLASILFTTAVFSQDIIVKTNRDTIFCKIKEIGSAEIKYLLPDYPKDVSFGIDIEKVRKVVFANGKEMKFTKEMNNPESYANDKKQALKVPIFAPLTGSFSVFYEKSIRPGRSYELGLGYIFGRPDQNINEHGVIFRAGFKFMRSPDFYISRMRYSHLLKGSYFKPEIIFNSYNADNRYHQTSGNIINGNVISLSLMFNIGKQIVYDNAFLIDYYIGAGYGIANEDVGYYYSNTIIDSSVPLSFTAGFKIGFLFR